jgi:hypothetical protein
MKLRIFAKLIAVLVFAFGVITFINAQLRSTKDQPKSFVVTYIITRSENGQTPVVTGTTVKLVNADGEWKQTKVRKLDDEYHEQVSVRFLDKSAPYKLEAGRLEYVGGTAENEIGRDRIARTPEWITQSPMFNRESTMLGLNVYLTHQDLSDGWVEQAFSPLTRSTPLLFREHHGNVETTEEAVSIQFRDVSQDEINPPRAVFKWL